jgi:uncharacterized membrane protein YwzB
MERILKNQELNLEEVVKIGKRGEIDARILLVLVGIVIAYMLYLAFIA